MKVCWKKNKNLKPDVIFKKIDHIKSLENGKLSFSDYEHQNAKAALESMIDFPIIASDLDKTALVSSSLWEVAKHPKSDARVFINTLDRNIRTEFAKRDNQYFILTSLSLANVGVRKIKINECVIKFYKSKFPSKFTGRKELIKNRKPGSEIDSIGYTKVVIEVTAKSEKMASSKALRELDLLRAMLAIFSNDLYELNGNSWEPINKVRLGEFHTVHKADGDIFNDICLYDPSYSQARIFQSKNMPIVLKNIKFVLNSLAKLEKKYKAMLNDSLLRFVRAFDEKDQNVAMMRAWGALESMAAPAESNGDAVTRRCSFLYEDHIYQKQILEHLREYRNRNVHAGEESKTAKSYGFQIQKYFNRLLLFHVKNAGKFDDIHEANKFLDLPKSENSLLAMKKLIDKSLKFRGYVS